MTYARDERLALCALLEETGPRAPTLCDGWTTADLAAHLVLRERRPDAAAGIMVGPLAGYTRRQQQRLALKTPFPRLIELIRGGPPRLSVFAIPGADQRLNFAEYFVHHEDVRRAQPDWEPRKLSSGPTETIWRSLGAARLLLRKVPVGIEFARDDDHAERASAGQRQLRLTVRARAPMVTVIGAPAELMLWAFGRTSAARVRLEGADADVAALRQSRWSV